MPLPEGVAGKALRFMIKKRVQEELNPVFQGVGEMIAGVEESEKEKFRLGLLEEIESVIGEIMQEQKRRIRVRERHEGGAIFTKRD